MNSVFIKAIFESCLPLYLTRENNLQQEATLSLLRDDSSEGKLWIHLDIRSFEHLRFLFINKLYNNRLSAFSMTETYPWRNPGKMLWFPGLHGNGMSRSALHSRSFFCELQQRRAVKLLTPLVGIGWRVPFTPSSIKGCGYSAHNWTAL